MIRISLNFPHILGSLPTRDKILFARQRASGGCVELEQGSMIRVFSSPYTGQLIHDYSFSSIVVTA